MGHHHPVSFQQYGKAFAWSVALNLAFVIVQVIYAFAANSMGLLADAVHNFGDVLGLTLAWGASWLASRTTAHERYSYGYKRTSILAAIINALLLVASCSLIAYESILKLISPEVVNEKIVIVVASIGVIINGGTALLFMKGQHSDLNIKGAFMHLAADALISLGVVLAGILILVTGWVWLDPVTGLLIVVAVLAGTWGLLRDSVNLILDAVPHHIDLPAVEAYLRNLPGVTSVHDLHIWGLGTQDNALTAHLVMPTKPLNDHDHQIINQELLEKFGIGHVTLQVEAGEHQDPCGQTHVC
ncbi:MAG: cation diffusion facilitator family transporter [Gammaproteobacteria bacterium]